MVKRMRRKFGRWVGPALAGLLLSLGGPPAVAEECQITFTAASPGVTVPQGGKATLVLSFATHGPCSWRLEPSLEPNPAGIAGSFLIPPTPLPPASQGGFLVTLTAPSGVAQGTYPARIRIGLNRISNGTPEPSEPQYVPIMVAVGPPAPPPAGRPAISGYAATNPRGTPILSAPPGAPVLILGSNLGRSGTVRFNAIPAPPAESWSPTEILVTVPKAAFYPFQGPVSVTVDGQTATGPKFTITVPPASELAKDAAAAVGSGLTRAGDALVCTRDSLKQVQEGKLMAVTAEGLNQAASAFQDTGNHLAQLKAQGAGIDDAVLTSYASTAASLSAAAQSISAGSFDVTGLSLELFAAAVGRSLPVTADAAHPEIAPALKRAQESAAAATEMAQLLADVKGDGTFVKQVTERLALLKQPSDELQRAASGFLAINDPQIRHWLGLDDAELATGLRNIKALAVDPQVVGWSASVTRDPLAWAGRITPYAFAGSLCQLGEALRAAGAVVTAASTSDLLDCPDECGQPDQKQNCQVVELGLSTGGAGGGNPDDRQRLEKVLGFFRLVPGASTGDLGPAAKDAVLQAVKALAKTATAASPTLWIKIDYGQCEKTRCHFLFAKNAWVQHTTGWAQVDESALGEGQSSLLPDGTWVPVGQWDAHVLDEIKKSIDKAAKKLCP